MSCHPGPKNYMAVLGINKYYKMSQVFKNEAK